MEQAIIFIHTFLRKEYETKIARWVEHDSKKFEARVSELNSFYDGGLTARIHRPPHVDASYFEDGKEQARKVQPRLLFQIKKYNHPIHGFLYCCYTSSTYIGHDTYFSKLYLADLSNKLKIVAIYNVCTDCNVTGQLNGQSCGQCSGSGWNWRGGQRLNFLDKPIEVHKIQPPTDPAHLRNYENNQL